MPGYEYLRVETEVTSGDCLKISNFWILEFSKVRIFFYSLTLFAQIVHYLLT